MWSTWFEGKGGCAPSYLPGIADMYKICTRFVIRFEKKAVTEAGIARSRTADCNPERAQL
jgi:hypothetical protein